VNVLLFHSVLTFTLAGVTLAGDRPCSVDAKWLVRGNGTGWHGVSVTRHGLYQATFEETNVGTCATPEEAARLVDREVRKKHRHRSKLNFPTKAEKKLLQQELLQKNSAFQQKYLLRQQNDALKRLKQEERLKLKQEKDAALKLLKQNERLKLQQENADKRLKLKQRRKKQLATTKLYLKKKARQHYDKFMNEYDMKPYTKLKNPEERNFEMNSLHNKMREGKHIFYETAEDECDAMKQSIEEDNFLLRLCIVDSDMSAMGRKRYPSPAMLRDGHAGSFFVAIDQRKLIVPRSSCLPTSSSFSVYSRSYMMNSTMSGQVQVPTLTEKFIYPIQSRSCHMESCDQNEASNHRLDSLCRTSPLEKLSIVVSREGHIHRTGGLESITYNTLPKLVQDMRTTLIHAPIVAAALQSRKRKSLNGATSSTSSTSSTGNTDNKRRKTNDALAISIPVSSQDPMTNSMEIVIVADGPPDMLENLKKMGAILKPAHLNGNAKYPLGESDICAFNVDAKLNVTVAICKETINSIVAAQCFKQTSSNGGPIFYPNGVPGERTSRRIDGRQVDGVLCGNTVPDDNLIKRMSDILMRAGADYTKIHVEVAKEDNVFLKDGEFPGSTCARTAAEAQGAHPDSLRNSNQSNRYVWALRIPLAPLGLTRAGLITRLTNAYNKERWAGARVTALAISPDDAQNRLNQKSSTAHCKKMHAKATTSMDGDDAQKNGLK